MSMFSLKGKVLNVFSQDGRLDKVTGEIGPSQTKVQIMGSVPAFGGESKFSLVDLTVPDGISFDDLKGKDVSVPLGVFAPSKGTIIYFIPKGSKVTTH